tara:strand:- start:2700 stop:5465 length:2766 start_codon:yes stop_codon:yes gene_type:complete
MVLNIVKKFFGSRNDRLLKSYSSKVKAINALESKLKTLEDVDFLQKTIEFRKRFKKGESLTSLQNEAFAVCREAARRSLGMRHFDVQLIGGMVLFDGKIAEMRTGEGKTLVATLPAYLASISGTGVHIVTVNDYLASRDSAWMGEIFKFLGLKVGVTLSGMEHKEKKEAYEADITYGTNNEFGFDYLRDNMATDVESRVQRETSFAIVDEVDSILVDEARTPLIISGQADDQIDLYNKLNSVPEKLERQADEDSEGDFYVDEKAKQITLSDSGFENSEAILREQALLSSHESLYDPVNIGLLHHLNAALRAKILFEKDQHYVVQNGKVIIVDEFTGRLMPGRRWSEGLHQAIEAKENVSVEPENQTLASITFQNYFRLYSKLAGMTGTADTEAYEFQQIYGLETVIVPTHKPMVRIDNQDLIYRTIEEKVEAIIEDISSRNKNKQPILVGTTSIESSEHLSSCLKKAGLEHQVLNAKQHEKEAEIIAQAGSPGMITIATNMAGRGTDIVLGGNYEPQISTIKLNTKLNQTDSQKKLNEIQTKWKKLHDEVIKSGGLHIIGTERHESRRIDNQLRGRAGRQGDPGSSRFYLAMDDPLLRIFAGEKMKAIMDRLGVPRGEAIEAGMVTRSIESAQRKVENRNFDVRKQLLEYDNVSNEQRKILYAQRNEILEADSVAPLVSRLREGALESIFRNYIPHDSIEEQWDLKKLDETILKEYSFESDLTEEIEKLDELEDDKLLKVVFDKAEKRYQTKVKTVGENLFNSFERSVLLQTIDLGWREHLAALDHLRQGIHLRGYAQKDPKQEYKKEAFSLFERYLAKVRDDVTKTLMTIQIDSTDGVENEIDENQQYVVDDQNLKYSKNELNENTNQPFKNDTIKKSNNTVEVEKESSTFRRDLPKVGRNEVCPCGSGKKYKHCHGKIS